MEYIVKAKILYGPTAFEPYVLEESRNETVVVSTSSKKRAEKLAKEYIYSRDKSFSLRAIKIVSIEKR